VDSTLAWFRTPFGSARLTHPVILPTDDYFPGEYSATPAQLRTALDRVCLYMGVDPEQFLLGDLSDYTESEAPDERPADVRGHLVDGHFRLADGRTLINFADCRRRPPMLLVAGFAREIAYAQLRGWTGHDPTRADNERVADLLTVYCGLGVFAANAAVDMTKRTLGQRGLRITMNRLGFLAEEAYGYALARYTLMRGEPDPVWAKHLDTNPRAYLRQSLRFLALQD
jgi:hypothetical protein